MITQSITLITNNLTLACQACRSNFMHGGKDAAGWAIMTMLVIIIPMLIAVGFFIFRIAKRQRIHSDSQYNDPFLNDHQSNK